MAFEKGSRPLSRRSFGAGLGSGLLFLASGVSGASANAAMEAFGVGEDSDGDVPVYFSAQGNLTGQYGLSALNAAGEVLFDLPLPERAHEIVRRPESSQILAMARRPGIHITIADWRKGEAIRSLEAEDGHHFFGHGVFSPDGRVLYVPENDLKDDTTRILVLDAERDYRLADRLELDGPARAIGAHEMRLSANGQGLVLALGGILTRPESGRDKLNLDDMRPALIRLDRYSGKVHSWTEPPADLHQCSIRHIDVNQHDDVAIGLQYQGPEGDVVPLVAWHRDGDSGLSFVEAPKALLPRMTQYCGSVRFDRTGRNFGISHPRGGMVTFWKAGQKDAEGRTALPVFSHHVDLEDGCGLAEGPGEGQFILTGGQGQIALHDFADVKDAKAVVERMESGPFAQFRWDNHLTPAS